MGEMIGVSSYNRLDSQSPLGLLPSCAIISVPARACACDGFAHGVAKIFTNKTTVVPLHGASTMTDSCTSERVRAKEQAVHDRKARIKGQVSGEEGAGKTVTLDLLASPGG